MAGTVKEGGLQGLLSPYNILKLKDVFRTHFWQTPVLSILSLASFLFNLFVYVAGLPVISVLGTAGTLEEILKIVRRVSPSAPILKEPVMDPGLMSLVIMVAIFVVTVVRAIKYSHPLLYAAGLVIEGGSILYRVNVLFIIIQLTATLALNLRFDLAAIIVAIAAVGAIGAAYRYIHSHPPFATYTEISRVGGGSSPRLPNPNSTNTLGVDHQFVVRVCGPPARADLVNVEGEPEGSWSVSERRKEGYYDVFRLEPKTRLQGSVRVYLSGKKVVLRNYRVEAEGPSSKVLNLSVLYGQEEYAYPNLAISTAKSPQEVTEELLMIRLKKKVDLSGSFVSAVDLSTNTLINPKAPIRSLRIEDTSRIHLLVI